jgi:uncharacterized membrane protein
MEKITLWGLRRLNPIKRIPYKVRMGIIKTKLWIVKHYPFLMKIIYSGKGEGKPGKRSNK